MAGSVLCWASWQDMSAASGAAARGRLGANLSGARAAPIYSRVSETCTSAKKTVTPMPGCQAQVPNALLLQDCQKGGAALFLEREKGYEKGKGRSVGQGVFSLVHLPLPTIVSASPPSVN